MGEEITGRGFQKRSAFCLECFRAVEDAGGAGGDLAVLEGGEGDPFGGGDIAGGGEGAGEEFAEVIDDDVVVFGAAVDIGHDAFEDGGDGGGADEESGFFEDFADDGGFEAFTGFDEAAGEGPPAFERGFAALNEEDFFATEDDGADAEEGAGGIVAGRGGGGLHFSAGCFL